MYIFVHMYDLYVYMCIQLPYGCMTTFYIHTHTLSLFLTYTHTRLAGCIGRGEVVNVYCKPGVEVCCSVLQCVAVCCSVLRCVSPGEVVNMYCKLGSRIIARYFAAFIYNLMCTRS